MTAIKDLDARITAIEGAVMKEPQGEFWQLIKHERTEREFPPPDPLAYGFPPGKKMLMEIYGYIQEAAAAIS
jgi:hypothetical protein